MPFEHPAPTDATKRALLAMSGNQCAFHPCPERMVDREHSVLIGKIAHIKARRKNGPRFDPHQTSAENQSVTNLIALCGKHHDIIDERDDIYTVDCLTRMKRSHEERIENSADRSWLRVPKTSVVVEGLGYQRIYFWTDRTGVERIYSDLQRAMTYALQEIFSSLGDSSREVLDLMSEIPDVTFGELLSYFSEYGGNPSKILIDGAKRLNERIATLSEGGLPNEPMSGVFPKDS